MIFKPEEFYIGFQLNYFDYRQVNNKYLLNLGDQGIAKLIQPILNGSKEEFLKSVRADIRLTFLLCVETLFELIFALLPDKNGKIDDKSLILRLAQKTQHQEDIRNFYQGEKSRLDSLDLNLSHSNGKQGTVLRHIFYYSLWKEELNKDIDSSLEVIKNSLKIVAKELTNREELNSYKHGLRGIPFLKSFMIVQKEDPSKKLKFNIDDSVTIYSFNKKTKSHEFLTKSFDSERDMLLTHHTSLLINNIIQLRKSLLPSERNKDYPVFLFEKEGLENASKVNVELQEFTFVISPKSKNEI